MRTIGCGNRIGKSIAPVRRLAPASTSVAPIVYVAPKAAPAQSAVINPGSSVRKGAYSLQQGTYNSLDPYGLNLSLAPAAGINPGAVFYPSQVQNYGMDNMNIDPTVNDPNNNAAEQAANAAYQAANPGGTASDGGATPAATGSEIPWTPILIGGGALLAFGGWWFFLGPGKKRR
jgi:hypothetical protein